MYGTHLKIDQDATYFENALMPSGRVIHVWKMMTVYHTDKIIPQLPILKQGHTYRFTFDYDVVPEGHVYFKVIFKKRNGVVLDQAIIQQKEAEITYPEAAFSYELQMINAAATSICFRAIQITAQADDQVMSELTISTIMNEVAHTSTINVVLVDEAGLTRDALQGLHNVILVENGRYEDLKTIAHCVQPLQQGYTVNFIGYTTHTNEMACRLAERLGETAWVSADVASFEQQHSNVYQYGGRMSSTSTHSLISPMFHVNHRLKALDRGRLNGGIDA